MFDQNGTDISLASQRPSPSVLNAPGDESGLSLSEIDELFLRVITELRRGVQAASQELAREEVRQLFPDLVTTRGQEAVSQFMLRLTLYYGLIGTTAEELRSISLMPPATDVSGSSVEQASPAPSPQTGKSSYIDPDDEPPIYSIVADHAGDIWHHRYGGWYCALGGDDYSAWDWDRLTDTYAVRLIRYGTEWSTLG